MPQPVDLVVHRRVLLDVGVGRGDVGLGLVVVVVGDEVLHAVVREELAELVGELGRQRLVRGQHEGGLLHLLDRPADRGALARPGDAEEGLEAVAPRDALGQRFDRGRLVARGLEVGHHLERRHGCSMLPTTPDRSCQAVSAAPNVGRQRSGDSWSIARKSWSFSCHSGRLRPARDRPMRARATTALPRRYRIRASGGPRGRRELLPGERVVVVPVALEAGVVRVEDLTRSAWASVSGRVRRTR